jgi:phosphate transport system substrate-binding protein
MRMTKTIALIALVAGALNVASAQVRINAAGATFPYPIYSQWFHQFQQQKGVQINYQSIGSGGGISALTAGTVDFGASDRPMTDAEIGKMKYKPLHFPTVVGAVVPTYNISGVSKDLQFTGEVLAGIFLGKITKWNDNAIKSINPGVSLPNADIVTVHRSDGSGTSFVFTDFLSKTSPEWKSKIGANQSPNWPGGLAAKGNEGVAGSVTQTPNSIGYVELIYALQNKMAFGTVKNASGQFVKGSLAGVTAAADAMVSKIPADFRVSITDAPGPTPYPISTFTYLLIPSTITDAGKKNAIIDFLHWMLTTGQGTAEKLNYSRLPQSLIAREEQQIGQIK